MVLGALLDAGLPLEELRRALGSLALDEGSVSASRVLRSGVSATKFGVEDVENKDRSHSHEHEHAHSHAHEHAHEHSHAHAHSHESPLHQITTSPNHHLHDHRSLSDINALIDRSSLSPSARTRAKDLFHTLGEAEAAIHQIPIE